MFDRSTLEMLTTYESEHPVVSLYLNLDASLRGTPDAYQTRLKGLLKQIQEKAANADIEAIENYLNNEFDWSGHGVAIFSSQAGGLWQAGGFDVPVRTYVHVGAKPFITPLADVLDQYGAYSVALIEQQSIRLMHFHLGQLIAEKALEGEEVKRLKGGGGAGGAARRGGDDLSGYVRETVRSNLKGFAEALVTFCTHHKTTQVLLGGAESTIGQFKGMLPQVWQDRVAGVFATSRDTGQTVILERTLELMQARQRAHEDKLVQIIKAGHARDGNGAVGIGKTIESIQAGRVQTLAVIEGYRFPGVRCMSCGYASTDTLDECPLCGEGLQESADLTEHLIRQTIEHGGEVTFLDTDSALTTLGGVGALLRY